MPLKLTRLGMIAYQYGATTPPNWYADVFTAANLLADDDGDWELLLQERIEGLGRMLEEGRAHGLSGIGKVPDSAR